MINNDVLRSIRYMLDFSDARVVEVVHLADPGFALDKAEIPALLKKEDEASAVVCSDALLVRFLDGLVLHYRGRDESLPPRPVEGHRGGRSRRGRPPRRCRSVCQAGPAGVRPRGG